jgi:hypothetical protein
MAKYESAFYEKGGETVEVPATELRDAELRAVLREKNLFNKNRNILLGIRNHPDTPHFYRKSSHRGDIDKGEPKDTSRHDEKRDEFLYFLENNANSTSSENLRIGIYEKCKEVGKHQLTVLNLLENYQWAKEVKFSVSEESYLRFDIFGRSKAYFGWVEKHPYVAIEIVDSHFSSKAAFKALLKMSQEFPIFIGYMFVSQIPYLNTKKNGDKSNSPKHIRFKHYIMDGSFWDQDERVDEGFDKIEKHQSDEYYNFVYDKIKPFLA